MQKETKKTQKNQPVFFPSAQKNWVCNSQRTMYVHRNGAVCRQVNAECKSCMKKFQVMHPNMKIQNKMIRAGASLAGGHLDRFVTGQAEKILEESEWNEVILASPMKMCIECGSVATLIEGCKCKNTMADSDGNVFINISGYKIEGPYLRFYLDMKGYKLMPMSLHRDRVKSSDMARVKDKLDTGNKSDQLAIHADYKAVRLQYLQGLQHGK